MALKITLVSVLFVLISISGSIYMINGTNSEALTTNRNSSMSIAKLCLDAEPDGTAVVYSNATKDLTLVVFKFDKFWMIPINDLYPFAQTYNRSNYLFGEENQLSSSQYWPQFPDRPAYALSFVGLYLDDKFFNNVLVFKEYDLFRYNVKSINAKSNGIDVTLVSKHRSTNWFSLPSFSDIQYLVIPEGTRVIISRGKAERSFVSHTYLLNEANLDNPVHYQFATTGLPNFNTLYSSVRFYYQFQSNSLAFLSTGQLCFNEDHCFPLRHFLNCQPQIQVFTDSFAYWLWKDTALTLRLIMVALSSVMLVNFALSLSFIYNQVKRIAALT